MFASCLYHHVMRVIKELCCGQPFKLTSMWWFGHILGPYGFCLTLSSGQKTKGERIM